MNGTVTGNIAGPDGRCIDFNRTWLEFTGSHRGAPLARHHRSVRRAGDPGGDLHAAAELDLGGTGRCRPGARAAGGGRDAPARPRRRRAIQLRP